jgi:hypothetical protein
MASRFTDHNPTVFIQENENQNTLRKTLAHVKLLQEFLGAKYKVKTPMHLIQPADLNKYVTDFIVNVRKIGGEEYEPCSLRSFVSSFDRQLKRHKYTTQIMSNSIEFSESREALRMKQRDLKSQGKGSRPNKADPLTDEEIQQLYASDQLGIKTPQSLINTMWYLNTLHFGIRGGCEEHRNICWGDIVLKNDPISKFDYLEYHERTTKTRTGEDLRNTRACPPRMYATPDNRERCPVHTYICYQARRPEDFCNQNDPFYLAPVTNNLSPSLTERWFLRGPVGANKLQSLMRKMAKKANLPKNKRITNTSVRKTLVQKMTDRNVPDSLQVYVTGHKNPSSLNNYRTLNDSHKYAISSILSDTSDNSNKREVQSLPVHHMGDFPMLGTDATTSGNSSCVEIPRQHTHNRYMTLSENRSSTTSMISGMDRIFHGNTFQNCTFNLSINTVTQNDP